MRRGFFVYANSIILPRKKAGTKHLTERKNSSRETDFSSSRDKIIRFTGQNHSSHKTKSLVPQDKITRPAG